MKIDLGNAETGEQVVIDIQTLVSTRLLVTASSGGTFGAYLSDLKQAGLILVDRDGVRANAETLFL